MVTRDAESLLKKYARQFRSLAVIGPRQSGKTTLVCKVFSRKPYVSLENPDERLFAVQDPRGFLSRFKSGAILDEVQRAPELFSYLQQILDRTNKDGLFILTGSNNFLLQSSISQSLAGRIGYIDLFPLSSSEINLFDKRPAELAEYIFYGGYPELFDKSRTPSIWYPSYIRTYIERDVKQLKNIENTVLFNRFIQLCAGRIGQQLNTAALSNECGIDVKTVNAWLSILQSSFIIYLLQPHFQNFNKRVVKTPKLYFSDTGVACSLLGIRKPQEISVSPFYGALTENFCINDLLKKKYNTAGSTSFFYWRDNKGVEIDLLLDTGKKLIPVEIKAAQTFNESFLKNMIYWNNISGNTGGILIYGGEHEYKRSDKIQLTSWKNLKSIKL
ncbi:ATP-binding protein [Parafilimonas sp.]|uniref:ATP-binding protein n=1 Tax=Parafilimonas sp. TaxID=1969739 RepID=UPI0039E53BD7